MQRAVTGLMHSGLVGYVGFRPSCKVPPPPLPGYGEPCGQPRLWGSPEAAAFIVVAVQGMMLPGFHAEHPCWAHCGPQ